MPYSFIFLLILIAAIVTLAAGRIKKNRYLKIASLILFVICFLMIVLLAFSLADM